MSQAQFNILVPTIAALVGALVGSISPIVVGLLNARAESRRERLRMAVRVAIEDYQHMTTMAQAKANAGTAVNIPPISAVLAYHVEIMELLHVGGNLEPRDLVALRDRAKASFDALAGKMPTAE